MEVENERKMGQKVRRRKIINEEVSVKWKYGGGGGFGGGHMMFNFF